MGCLRFATSAFLAPPTTRSYVLVSMVSSSSTVIFSMTPVTSRASSSGMRTDGSICAAAASLLVCASAASSICVKSRSRWCAAVSAALCFFT